LKTTSNPDYTRVATGSHLAAAAIKPTAARVTAHSAVHGWLGTGIATHHWPAHLSWSQLDSYCRGCTKPDIS